MLDRFQLKVIMVIFMFMDHIGEFIVGTPVWFRYIGRVVAPVFIFFVYEGYYYTKDRGKYLKRLLIGAEVMALGNILVSIIFKQPNKDVVRSQGNVNIPMSTINIISIISICIIGYMIYKSYKNAVISQKRGRVIGLILIIISAFTQMDFVLTSVGFIRNNIFLAMAYSVILLNELEEYGSQEVEKKSKVNIVGVTIATLFTEGSVISVGIILILNKLKNRKLAQYLAYGALSLLFFPFYNTGIMFYERGCQWMMIFSLIFIWLYNKKKGKDYKYFFYVFYPLHIWIIYTIGNFVN